MTIHFICRGNVLRSLIAETYLKSLVLPRVTALSSGTMADAYRISNAKQGYTQGARRLLAEHGLAAYTKKAAEQLNQERLADDQLVICVNTIACDEAKTIVRLPPSTIVWDVMDIGEGTRIANSEAERAVYEEEIYGEIVGLVDELVHTQHLARA